MVKSVAWATHPRVRPLRLPRGPRAGLTLLFSGALATFGFAKATGSESSRATQTELSASSFSNIGLRQSDGTMSTAPAQAPLVVLIAIDGVRWQDVFEGPNPAWLKGRPVPTRSDVVPQLMDIERSGVALGQPGSAGFFASGPNYVSLPGYMEMLSGSRRTGCTENDCKTIRQSTLLDDFYANGGNPADAGVFASWQPLERAAAKSRSSGVVSTGPQSGSGHDLIARFPEASKWLERGRSEVGKGHLRSDSSTAQLALAYLREATPRFVFISLGETDEHAHAGDYGGYLEALRAADSVVGKVREQLAQVERSGRQTALFVTTDHGRAADFTDHGRRYPESARSFLFATGSRIQSRRSGARAYLSDIAPTIRTLSGLPALRGPDAGRVLTEILAQKR